MPEQYSYVLLKKKISKVDALLRKLSLLDKDGTKEFRGYERKRQEYIKQIETTKEYKEERLANALNDLRTMSHRDDHQNEVDYNSSISTLSQREVVDYELTLKKYDKVCRLLLELEGTNSSKARNNSSKTKNEKLYHQYVRKQKEYLNLLETCEEWEEESYRRMEAQAIADAKARAAAEQEEEIAEQERKIKAAREAANAELEQQKKDAIAKVRAKAQKQKEMEEQKEAAYRESKRLEGSSLVMDSERLVMETKKREEELEKLYQEQEARGMIRRIGK
jgi:hypothetical protein